MAYVAHKNAIDDLVLLENLSNEGILTVLKKHMACDEIYVFVGEVLLSVNPYKMIKNLYCPATLVKYPNRYLFDNPPHVYAIANAVVKNIRMENENQCVIISGESGAGKTEAAKKIMEYVAAVSSKAADVEGVKELILESNPLLEAFGNAKTIRNNNSSRFGKYFEIQFNHAGDPVGGKITNYLLEKSRIVGQAPKERNFHVFYQLLVGASAAEQKDWKLHGAEIFSYLNKSGSYKVDGMNDKKEFGDMRHAMGVVGLSAQDQGEVFRLISGILHLGNLEFKKGDTKVVAAKRDVLETVSHLLRVAVNDLELALTHKTISSVREVITSPLEHIEEAVYSRDSLAKAIYSRLFDFIVRKTNDSMAKFSGDGDKFVIGVLDIYGFEIFDCNSFEQLCINFVNEKLQQLFIMLTLKKEQEEYVREGIPWKDIDYYNNLPCCELVEKRGCLLALLDEECLFPKGTDKSFLEKIQKTLASHPNFGALDGKKSAKFSGFLIKHFAGDVTYCTDNFLDKNKDLLLIDLVSLMTGSSTEMLKQFFAPDAERMKDSKKRPITAGGHFKTQVSLLMDALQACVPHYIRCIKPNESKRAGVIEDESTMRQIKYLGLLENVKVRRAGYAFRLPFKQFLHRYKMLSADTWPRWDGDDRSGCEKLLKSMQVKSDEIQWGKTKVFVKSPETVFDLERQREKGLSVICTKIQRCYRAFAARKWYLLLKSEMQNLIRGKKERCKGTLNRKYWGDYLAYRHNSCANAIILAGGDKRVLFSDFVHKVNRRFKVQRRAILVTESRFINIEVDKKKRLKVKREVALDSILGVSLSNLSDSWIIVHQQQYDFIFFNKRKTELVVCLSEHFKSLKKTLKITFSDRVSYRIKSGEHVITFQKDDSATDSMQFKAKGKEMIIRVPGGLDSNTEPRVTYVPPGQRRR